MTEIEILEILKSEEFGECFSGLYYRWEDEKAYENIKDYAIPIQDCFGLKIREMCSDPFGFIIETSTITLNVSIVFGDIQVTKSKIRS